MRRYFFLFLMYHGFCFANWAEWKRASQGEASAFIEADVLMDLVQREKSDICVDTRGWMGIQMHMMAKALQYKGKGIVYGIDPWDNEASLATYEAGDVQYDIARSVALDKERMSLKRKLIASRANAHCAILKVDPTKGAMKFEDGVIDIFHTNGKLGLQDAVLFLPKIRKNGFLFIENVLWDHSMPEVQELLVLCDSRESTEDALILQKTRM